MKNDELLKAFNEFYRAHERAGGNPTAWDAFIAGFNSRQAESWIPVSQKLPEKIGDISENVLVCNSSGQRAVGFYAHYKHEWAAPIENVTHWRELPAGPNDHQWEWDLVIGRCKCGAIYPGEKGEE